MPLTNITINVALDLDTEGSTVDTLGLLKARIAEMQAMAKSLEVELKANKPGTYTGQLYSVTVTEVAPSDRVNYKDMAAEMASLLSPAVVEDIKTNNTNRVEGYTRLNVRSL